LKENRIFISIGFRNILADKAPNR